MSYDFGGDPVDAVGNLEEAMRIYSAMCEGPEGDPPAQVIDLINELDRRDEIGDDGFLGGYSMGSRLVGKVALISGAARGMGSTEAGLLVDEGAKVVLGDLLDKEGQFIADDLNKGATSKRAIYLHLDVTSANDWANAVAIAVREFSLNVLVNNAGVLSMLGLEEETEEGWQRVVDINQKGVWLGMRAAVPAMRRAGGGSIVNISSMYGLIGSGAATAYQGSKGAVRILIKTAAVQYTPENIRVNSVHPGITTTPMVERGVAPEGRQAIVALTPLRREARPEEVAYAVLFLASDEASYITGAELAVDGGYSAA